MNSTLRNLAIWIIVCTPAIAAAQIDPTRDLKAQAADTVLMNASGSAASPSPTAVPNCPSGVTYSTSAHAWACVTGGIGNVSTSGLTSGSYPVATGANALGDGIMANASVFGMPGVVVNGPVVSNATGSSSVQGLLGITASETTHGRSIMLLAGAYTDGTPADDIGNFEAFDLNTWLDIPLRFAGNAMTIYPAGNPDFPSGCGGCVGIGTTNPNHMLELATTANAPAIVNVTGAGAGYQYNGAAPNMHVLLGNGVAYVDSALPNATNSQVAKTGANTTMSSTSTYYDGPSTASLDPGTYLVSSQLLLGKASATAQAFAVCKLWDGTNVYGSTYANMPYVTSAAITYATPAITAIVTVSATATLKMSCKPLTASEVIYTSTPTDTLAASTISAVRLY